MDIDERFQTKILVTVSNPSIHVHSAQHPPSNLNPQPPLLSGRYNRDVGETIQFLRAPSLLVATSKVLDPFFFESLILLTGHTEEYSAGVILNRPTEIPLSRVLDRFEIDWTGEPRETAWFGGPVEPTSGLILYRAEEALGDSIFEMDDVRITLSLEVLGRLASRPPEEFRLLLGYAGWGPGQLATEIANEVWTVMPPHDDLLFTRSKDVWRTATERSSSGAIGWIPGSNEPN